MMMDPPTIRRPLYKPELGQGARTPWAPTQGVKDKVDELLGPMAGEPFSLAMLHNGFAPKWLLVPDQMLKPGAITWAFAPRDPSEAPVIADRIVIIDYWVSYFRLPHWPPNLFRLGSFGQRSDDPSLPLASGGHEFICDEQDVYYHEATLTLNDDPFAYLKDAWDAA